MSSGGFMKTLNRPVLPVLLAVCAFIVTDTAASGAESNVRSVPLQDAASWHSEIFAGARNSTGFTQGSRIGAGLPGVMAFDAHGNAFAGCGSFVYAILQDSSVHLLAGLPDFPGLADGPADRAVLGSVAALTVAEDGSIIAGDVIGHCIKRIRRDRADKWIVETVAGVPGKSGYKDGPAGEALFARPDGVAAGNGGIIYVLDGDWLRCIRDGRVMTLNYDGGTGFADGQLDAARFRRLSGGSQGLAISNETLYVADSGNNALRIIDLAERVVATVTGGASAAGETDSAGDSSSTNAHFFSAGGPCTVIRDPSTGWFFTSSASDPAIKVLSDDKVWTFDNSAPARTGGGPALLGVDLRGRVYVSSAGNDLIRRFTPAQPREVTGVAAGDNPFGKLTMVPCRSEVIRFGPDAFIPLPETNSATLQAGELRVVDGRDLPPQLAPAVVAGNGEYVMVWQYGSSHAGQMSGLGICQIQSAARSKPRLWGMHGAVSREQPSVAYCQKNGGYLVVWQERKPSQINYSIRSLLLRGDAENGIGANLFGGTETISQGAGNEIHPVAAGSGAGFLVVWSKYMLNEELGPHYAVWARVIGPNGKAAGPEFEVAPAGGAPSVGYNGQHYVVAYETPEGIMLQRISTEGDLVGITGGLGQVFARRPVVAGNGDLVAVSGAHQPEPDAGGLGGPGAICVSRYTRSGNTPERFAVEPDQVASGGFAGLLDSAKQKGHKGWPAMASGAFEGTQNGYWPHLYSGLTWDGKTWVAVWVRAKLNGSMLEGQDLFACRIDSDTMMPDPEPMAVDAGDDRIGVHTRPVLASTGGGISLLAYTTAGADGNPRVACRFLTGGKHSSQARVVPDQKRAR